MTFDRYGMRRSFSIGVLETTTSMALSDVSDLHLVGNFWFLKIKLYLNTIIRRGILVQCHYINYHLFCRLNSINCEHRLLKIGTWSQKKGLRISSPSIIRLKGTNTAFNRTRIVTSILVSLLIGSSRFLKHLNQIP